MMMLRCSSVLFVFAYVLSGDLLAFDLGALKQSIVKAGQQLKAGEISDCITNIQEASDALPGLVVQATPKELTELKGLHAKLLKAHELLAIEGAELDDLPSWDELIKIKKSGGAAPSKKPAGSMEEKKKGSESTGVSFTRDLAPWLVSQCGRCHVSESRGRFSMATFEALMKGTRDGVVLLPGDPVGSRFVEVIETGDMPRGGGKVSPENLAKLKQWVTEGAKFDGPAATAPLPSLVTEKAPDAAAPMKSEPAVVAMATGKETVSFSQDIAPILIANCNGCHYNGTRNSGGLRFDDFAGLLKGGTSGLAIEAGKPEESLLIRKLRGSSGARMPLGRAPLEDDKIKLVATWISEGATFDGYSQDGKLDQVVGKAWASKAGHEELMAKRMDRAREKWKIVSPKSEPSEASDQQFHVIGDIGDENAKLLLSQANNALKQVKKMFKITGNDPILKGGITIFALKQRYDYSEFGTMAEGGRSIPSEWSSHWRKETLDTYIAIIFDKTESKINESSLVQQISSLWVGSMDGVPKWFADGAGRNALANLVGQNDARVQAWVKRVPESMKQLEDLKRLMNGNMNDEDAATIGFGVIRWMYDSKMKSQYETILRTLASGSNFEQATTKAIGPIEVFLKNLLGKTK
jgi:mono/diheme cytochrome c family protein